MISEQPTAIEQINQRAHDEVARLEAERAQLLQEITSLQAEQAQLHLERKDRMHDLTTSTAHVARLTDEHNTAIHFASLATGTTQEPQTLRAAAASQKDLEKEQKALSKQQKELDQREAAAQHREQEILDHLDQLQKKLTAVQSRLPGVEAARIRAHTELGEQVRTSIMSEYDRHQALIDQLRSQLIQAQLAQQASLDEALPRLKDWPGIHRQLIQELRPIEDATSRTISAAIDYLETIMRERHDLKGDLPCPAARGPYLWYELLAVPQSEIAGRENIKARPIWLEDRLRRLRALNKEYQALIQAQ